jgi:beta-glucosidase
MGQSDSNETTAVPANKLNRRELIRSAALLGGGLLICDSGVQAAASAAGKSTKVQYAFPKNFLWGAGTAGLQHEGSPLADGAGPSMMYHWAHTAGKVPTGGTFDVSADQYRRFPSDIRLMRELNFNAYNFEIYWPRILPEGTGRVNPRGLAFYDELVDRFLAAGITPLCNLYVHDYPAALDQRGGWLNRDSADWFADYATIVFRRLGDRIALWTTMCETHIYGPRFVPALKDPAANLRAKHHLLLGQGRAVQAFRASGAKGQIGNYQLVDTLKPASDRDVDVAATARAHAYNNLLLLDSQMRGEYPPELMQWYGKSWPADAIREGDLATIRAPIDFFGMDYYHNSTIQHDPYGGDLQVRTVSDKPDAEGMRDALVWVRERYGNIPIYLTEIGTTVNVVTRSSSVPLETPRNGQVDDAPRITYLRDLLVGAHKAIQEGVDLRGVFAWSFVDGWEFISGLSIRYGLVYVDYETQQRIVKSSGRWYGEVIAANGFNVPAA